MKRIVALVLAVLMALSALGALADYDKATVKAVQQALNDAGFNCGTPDGIAGKKTTAAVQGYQEANGLEVTGVIDDALLSALGLAESKEAPAEAGTTSSEAASTAQVRDAGVPEDLVKYLGGIPATIDELSKRTNLSMLKYVCENWELTSFIDELRETGEATITLPGLGKCEMGYLSFYLPDYSRSSCYLAGATKGDQHTLTITEGEIPEKMIDFSFDISSLEHHIYYEAESGKTDLDDVDEQVFGRANYDSDGLNISATTWISNTDFVPERVMSTAIHYDADGDGYYLDLTDRVLGDDDNYHETHYSGRYNADGQRLWSAVGNTVTLDDLGLQYRAEVQQRIWQEREDSIATYDESEGQSYEEWLCDPNHLISEWWRAFSTTVGAADDLSFYDTLANYYLPELKPIDDLSDGRSYQRYEAPWIRFSVQSIRQDGAYVCPSEASVEVVKSTVDDLQVLSSINALAAYIYLDLSAQAFGFSEEERSELRSLIYDAQIEDGSIDLDEFENGILLNTDAGRVWCYGVEDEDMTSVEFSIERDAGDDDEEGVEVFVTGDEVPELPERALSAFGGIPQTVDDLMEQFHCGDMPELYESYQPMALLDTLLEEHSFTLQCEEYGDYYISLGYMDLNEDWKNIDLTAEYDAETGTLTASTEESIPGASYLMYCELDLTFWNYEMDGRRMYLFAERDFSGYFDGNSESATLRQKEEYYGIDGYSSVDVNLVYDGESWTMAVDVWPGNRWMDEWTYIYGASGELEDRTFEGVLSDY